jgi:hypothetical protein
MGTAALLRAVTQAGLEVTGQSRHADREFVYAATPSSRAADDARPLEEVDCR